MENPTDRVTYGDLRMIRAEFEELMQLSIEAGTIKHPIAYENTWTRASRKACAGRPPSRCEMSDLRQFLILASLLCCCHRRSAPRRVPPTRRL